MTCNATVSGGTSPYSISWTSAGSPSSGSGTSYTTVFAAKGTYNVAASVRDANGATVSGSAPVSVAPQTLSIAFSNSPAVVNQPVTFTATSTGGTSPYSFSWSFGDGGTSTASSPTHTYVTSGTFNVQLNVTDSNNVVASISHSVTVSGVSAGDFSLSASPDHLTLSAGTSRSVTVVVHSLNNFAGDVTLTVTVTPTVTDGPTGTLSKTTVTLKVNATQNAKLLIATTSSTPAGSYEFTVTATSGSLSHKDTIALTVRGPLSINAKNHHVSVQAGSDATLKLNIHSDGLKGPIQLSTTVTPSVDNGPSLSLARSRVTLSQNGASVIVRISTSKDTPQRTYAISIRGTSHGFSSIFTGTLTVTTPVQHRTTADIHHDFN